MNFKIYNLKYNSKTEMYLRFYIMKYKSEICF